MSAPARIKFNTNFATAELWRLAETGDVRQLEYLLASGAKINAINGDGVTPLMRAAYYGQVEMVRALIDHGANLNARRADGLTPLILAAFFGHEEVVRTLVERGADMTSCTRFGTSAQMWATARSFREIADYLAKASNGAARHADALELGPNDARDDLPNSQLLSVRDPISADLKIVPAASTVGIGDEAVSDRIQQAVLVHGEQAEVEREERMLDDEDEETIVARPALRTLSDPPEIWNLVQENRVEFKPGWAFVNRITSSGANLTLLVLVVILVSGLGTFGFLKLRGDLSRGANAEVKQSASQPNVPVKVDPEVRQTNTVNQSTDSQLIKPAEDAIDTKQLSNHETERVGEKSSSTSSPPTQVKHVGSNNPKAGQRQQQRVDSRPARKESRTTTSAVTAPKRPTPDVVTPPRVASSINIAPVSQPVRTPQNPPKAAPPKTTATPKPKVIQWP